MKKLLLISAMALAVSTAYADNTDTKEMNASGKVIADLTVTTPTAMTLPDLVAPDVGGSGTTSVTMTCATTTTTPDAIGYTGNGNPFADGTAGTATVAAGSANVTGSVGNHTGTCATATVTGQADYHFAIALDSISTVTNNIVMSNVHCDGGAGSNATAVLTGGTAALSCGATITAAVGALGDYAETANLTVTYD